MKKYTLLSTLVIFVLVNACSVDVKINEDSHGIINIKTRGSNSNGTVSQHGYLEVDINGIDDDGIESISIKVPVFNMDLFVNNNSEYTDSWHNSYTFNNNEDGNEGVHSIEVILIDNDGNEYSKTVTFRII